MSNYYGRGGPVVGSSGNIENLDWDKMWGWGPGFKPWGQPGTMATSPPVTAPPAQTALSMQGQPSSGGGWWQGLGRRLASGGQEFLKSIKMGPERYQQWKYEQETMPEKIRMMAIQKMLSRQPLTEKKAEWQGQSDIDLAKQKTFYDYILASPKPAEAMTKEKLDALKRIMAGQGTEIDSRFLGVEEKPETIQQALAKMITAKMGAGQAAPGATQPIQKPAIPTIPTTTPITPTIPAPVGQPPAGDRGMIFKDFTAIAKLKQQGMTNSQIAQFLREVGLKPEDYGIIE